MCAGVAVFFRQLREFASATVFFVPVFRNIGFNSRAFSPAGGTGSLMAQPIDACVGLRVGGDELFGVIHDDG